ARNASVHAGSVPEAVASENMLTGALRQLFALSEAYPDLKANQNFLQLQNDLTGIENKIAYTRQAYNDAVLQYNNKVETFPGVVVAGLMGKTEKAMFEIEDATQREVPRVSFS
ncbi:MAG TPA: LemA family protein, partial [bacterium]|nr:LemA family protein [bacterium]